MPWAVYNISSKDICCRNSSQECKAVSTFNAWLGMQTSLWLFPTFANRNHSSPWKGLDSYSTATRMLSAGMAPLPGSWSLASGSWLELSLKPISEQVTHRQGVKFTAETEQNSAPCQLLAHYLFPALS
jgi:hypothetical protein